MRTWYALDVQPLAIADGDLLQAALTDYHVVAVNETTSELWRVFFNSVADRDRAAWDLREEFPTLTFSPVDVPDEDWAARSQASVLAVHVGRVIVAPPWDVPLTVTIRPSMGFGTGHHATTRLCLAALQRLELSGRRVLDVGTGSGVLAIVASRLGAGDVTGIDDDPDAVHSAWDNLALNPDSRVTLLVGDFRTTEILPSDVVIANLTGSLLIASASRLLRLASAGGRLILSGLLTSEEAAVQAAFAELSIEHRGEEDGWVSLTLSV